MALKKIRVEHLREGMHIHEFCGSWMEHPFWRSNFLLKDPEDLRRIRQSGITEIWIDTGKGCDLEVGESPAAINAAVDQLLGQAIIFSDMPAPVDLADEVQRAAKLCEKSRRAVIAMFHHVRMGRAVDAKAAGELVDEISASVHRNPDALVSLARLKSADDYTYMHSVAVCALMVALSRQLGLDEADTREAGLAGLLHDIGKALTPSHILNKPGKLTDEEFEIMRRHPLDGHKLLEEGRAVGDVVLDVCLHHHEKVDGSGYPHRMKSEEISLFARMGAVCDVYDAITSDRPYKAGWNPGEALRKMAEWSKGHFDESIFRAFVKTIGIYPVGSLVRLSSGRLGVVTEQISDSLTKPKVRVFFSTRSKAYIKPELLDLSRPRCLESIVGCESANRWGIGNLEQFWRIA
ncbi:HD-GYP domain-containing protein [Dechloromonas agitata]|uniref:HD-GYP domain-containing protein n=1 Tax=Dechloromonas agitata TaxID=73030 RepID=UPI0004B389D0|nr:HD-GYP domain-containing protein [Dechloromonas agitata]